MMRDKIKPIDVSILSSYMGRALTIVVTIVVIGIAVSAYLTGGPERSTVRICVPAGRSAARALRTYEPLRALLSSETRRPAELIACEGVWPPDCDLYVMPVHEYLRYEEALDVTALYEVLFSTEPTDSAVLVARAPSDIDFAELDPGDIVFAGPSSVNGYWVQMASLARLGFAAPEGGEGLRFEPSDPTGERAVLGVLHGVYRLGACTQDKLAKMTDRGIVRPGELEIVVRDEALPDLVIATRESGDGYYRRKLGRLSDRLAREDGAGAPNANVRLLKAYGIGGLRPVAPERMQRVRALSQRFGRTF